MQNPKLSWTGVEGVWGAKRIGTVVGLGAMLSLCAALMVGAAAPDAQSRAQGGPDQPAPREVDSTAALLDFHARNPKTRLQRQGERISQVMGAAFAHGNSPADSAGRFLDDHAGIFGVAADNLVGRPAVPVMYNRENGTYKFTSFRYHQELEGIEVFRSALVLLVRNEAGHPLVLANADLRDLGGFEVPGPQARMNEAQLHARVHDLFDEVPEIRDSRWVIWAGVDEAAPPRLARSFVAAVGAITDPAPQRVLYVVDGLTGAILFEESRIFNVDVSGNVSGMATTGMGADFCNDEIPTGMPYARVSIGGTEAYADINGDFVIPNEGTEDVTVNSAVEGLYFVVSNQGGPDALLSQSVTPPGPADFLHNAANSSELPRAEINAYIHANLVRDWVLDINPAYPVVSTDLQFQVNVNIANNCNAFYAPGDPSINFYTSGGGCPNTGFDSVVYHEYGHHLVASAGSGQGAYGEGMSDCISVLVLDSPILAAGWSGSCATGLRTADNNCQASATCSTCGSGFHSCGQVLSGSVWDLRNELLATEPTDYLQIASDLTVNSILLHTGTAINTQITADFLTLDDDNDNIFDGTPHYEEIDAAFSAHNLPAPELDVLAFNFPNGIPDLLDPSGEVIRVEVSGVGKHEPQPGTGVLHLSTPGGVGEFTQVPMNEVSPNIYDAEFPAFGCATPVAYYFSAETTLAEVGTWPRQAPDIVLSAVAATGMVVALTDDFETDTGWTVSNSPSLLDGPWERGVPFDDGVCPLVRTLSHPDFDGDGSGQCYLTDNSAAAACNSDVDEGSTTLTSPLIDASGGEGAYFISYFRWFSNDTGNGPNTDTFDVEISDDGGDSWVTVENVGPGGPGTAGDWFHASYRISDFVEETNAFRIRFTASDGEPQSIVEAAVDGVVLSRFVCDDTPCLGDVDDNGTVNVDDLTAVILDWGCTDPPGPCPGDVDNDGDVDVDDLVTVILEWGDC